MAMTEEQKNNKIRLFKEEHARELAKCRVACDAKDFTITLGKQMIPTEGKMVEIPEDGLIRRNSMKENLRIISSKTTNNKSSR